MEPPPTSPVQRWLRGQHGSQSPVENMVAAKAKSAVAYPPGPIVQGGPCSEESIEEWRRQINDPSRFRNAGPAPAVVVPRGAPSNVELEPRELPKAPPAGVLLMKAPPTLPQSNVAGPSPVERHVHFAETMTQVRQVPKWDPAMFATSAGEVFTPSRMSFATSEFQVLETDEDYAELQAEQTAAMEAADAADLEALLAEYIRGRAAGTDSAASGSCQPPGAVDCPPTTESQSAPELPPAPDPVDEEKPVPLTAPRRIPGEINLMDMDVDCRWEQPCVPSPVEQPVAPPVKPPPPQLESPVDVMKADPAMKQPPPWAPSAAPGFKMTSTVEAPKFKPVPQMKGPPPKPVAAAVSPVAAAVLPVAAVNNPKSPVEKAPPRELLGQQQMGPSGFTMKPPGPLCKPVAKEPQIVQKAPPPGSLPGAKAPYKAPPEGLVLPTAPSPVASTSTVASASAVPIQPSVAKTPSCFTNRSPLEMIGDELMALRARVRALENILAYHGLTETTHQWSNID